LRHEIFLFSLQFSATLVNLAQNGQFLYDDQARKVNLPKMGKCFTTIVGKSNWSWLSCLTYAQSFRHRGVWWVKTPYNAPSPPKLKYENYILVEFCQFLQCQGINREAKNSTLTITSGDVHPKLTLAIMLSDFHLGTKWTPLLSWWK